MTQPQLRSLRGHGPDTVHVMTSEGKEKCLKPSPHSLYFSPPLPIGSSPMDVRDVGCSLKPTVWLVIDPEAISMTLFQGKATYCAPLSRRSKIVRTSSFDHLPSLLEHVSKASMPDLAVYRMVNSSNSPIVLFHDRDPSSVAIDPTFL